MKALAYHFAVLVEGDDDFVGAGAASAFLAVGEVAEMEEL